MTSSSSDESTAVAQEIPLAIWGSNPWEELLRRARVFVLCIPARREHAALLMEAWGFEAELVAGVPKEAVDLDAWAADGRVVRCEAVTAARAACHAGHRDILQRFLADGDGRKDLALIFEDDLEDRPAEQMREELSAFLAEVPGDFELLHLGFLWENRAQRPQVSAQVFRTHSAVGRHAYLVTRSGAEALLRATSPQDAPGDQMYLRAMKKLGLAAYQPLKPIFRQDRLQFASELSLRWRPARDFRPEHGDGERLRDELASRRASGGAPPSAAEMLSLLGHRRLCAHRPA